MPKHVKIEKEEDYEPNLRLIEKVTDPDVLWRKAKPLDLRPKSEGETSKDYVIRRFGVNSVVSNTLLGGLANGAHDPRPDAAGQCALGNKNGSYFEKLPDHSEYFLRANGHEKLKTRAGAGWGRRGFHRPKVYFNTHLLPEDLKKEEKEEYD
ncbi:hypothetical protein FRC00_008853 [Tulasnella sp. 408]|nr:hypothetical protein FRC00_008853 [Tulasnella sp. 408]